jgi:hypothetical protein
MTTTRARWFRATTVAALLAFTSGVTTTTTARAQSTPSTETTPATSGPAPATPAEPASPAPASNRTLWPWVIMGTGVALIATAAVLQFRAVSEDDERESDEVKLIALPQGDPQRKELQQSASDHDESATNSRTASLVVGTVGFLAVAGSVVLWFFEGGSSAPSSPSASSAKLKPTFTPSFAPGYAGATLGARF